jgi:transcriptional regulator with XRE-family HTH domain
MTTYGTKLSQLRNKAKLSQQEVADFIGISRSTYNSWESDQASYKVEYLTQLADVFKVSPLELLPNANPIKIVNNHDNKDNSINAFEVSVDAKELYKELLSSKDEIIAMLKEQLNSKI